MAGRIWERNLLGSAAILATILGIVFVLPAVERAAPAYRTALPERHIVADDISVIPPVGALIAQRTRTGPTTGSILFVVGPARYVISVEPSEGDLVKASDRLRTKIQGMRGYQVTSPERAMVTGSGLSGLAGTFTAPGRSGRYIAFVAPGRTIEVTVTVSQTDFQALPSIEDSIASIEWSGGP